MQSNPYFRIQVERSEWNFKISQPPPFESLIHNTFFLFIVFQQIHTHFVKQIDVNHIFHRFQVGRAVIVVWSTGGRMNIN